MEIEEKGELTKYEPAPKRKLYIAVYKLIGGGIYSSSNENKQALIESVQRMYGAENVRIYSIDCEGM